MVSLRWSLPVFAVVVAALIGGAILIQRITIDRLLHDDAAATGRNWTEYLAGNIGDLAAIGAGAKPSATSLGFLEQGKKVGRVFLYKIFNAEGYLRYISDATLGGVLDESALAKHNPEAAEAVEARESVVEVKEGSPPRRPPFYAETYVPLLVDGKVTAVIETYIDQTAKRHTFEAAFNTAAVALGLLIAFAFGVPSAAWYLRGRDKQKADARIHYLANYDPLTGLSNRAQLVRRLERAFGGAGKSAPVAVHAIDLDRFKDINDTLGHDAGDLLIRGVADRLRAAAGPNDIVARIGGDEFAVVQVNPGDQRGAETLAEKIVAELKAPYWLGGREVKVAARVGVAIAPEHGTDAGRLMKSADLALAKGKAAGGVQRFRLFSSDLDEELYRRLNIEGAILRALESGGFILHYQPQYSLPGERLSGFEALLRLPARDGGFIPPATFIPVAEKMGLIDRIGAWVLEQAATAATRWADHIKVSVNLSPAQFAVGDVAVTVARALKASRLDAARLELEITESLLMRDTEAVLADLAAIKSLGAAIVMDDFGTGYSSLNYLWRFPFDKIKIDRSFIVALEAGDPSAPQIIRTIVALGRSLNMRVNVEGVENERQAAFVREIGCDEVQGFFFGRPAPETEIARIILADFRSRASEDFTRVGRAERATG